MVSGGSLLSWSLTCGPLTVKVQLSPGAKSLLGSMVKVVGPPVTTLLVSSCVPLVVQTISNQAPVTVTGSVKVTVTFFCVPTPLAPGAGSEDATAGAASTPKVKMSLAAMLLGGSPVSWSATWAANTVVVQLSPPVKLAFGLMVKVVGPPVTTVSATLRLPEVAQTIWNQLPVTFTGSLKVTVTSLLSAPKPPLVGVVAVTVGAESVVKLKG